MRDLTRRKLLIDRMNELESQGKGCSACPGTCCTFEANSMMMTPLEAFEILTYLKENGLLNSDLKNKFKQTVTRFRLEPKLMKGRSYLRKTYTCPFFNHQELGCPLPRTIKPYGCLAFDSHDSLLKGSGHCYSENDLLKEREKSHPEEQEMNETLRKKFDLYWEKSPIPNALLELWEKTTEVES